LNRSVAEVLTARAEMRRRAERDAVQLALLIAQRVLHREMSIDENALAGVARAAFDRITRSESYRVTVHPRFASALAAALPASQSGRIQIDPDPNCAPGTLIIRSADGTIDASVETQLEEITRGLTDRLSHSS
jgi:flagellar assembly protein FliH